MPGSQKRIYWDSNCFLSFLNNDQRWIQTLNTLLDEANKGSIMIVTSVLSKTEVAFSAMESQNRVLTPEEEERIDLVWSGNRGVRVVEFNELIAVRARDIRRDDMIRGWTGRRTPDIIHLATASFMGVEEMHTTEKASTSIRNSHWISRD